MLSCKSVQIDAGILSNDLQGTTKTIQYEVVRF